MRGRDGPRTRSSRAVGTLLGASIVISLQDGGGESGILRNLKAQILSAPPEGARDLPSRAVKGPKEKEKKKTKAGIRINRRFCRRTKSSLSAFSTVGRKGIVAKEERMGCQVVSCLIMVAVYIAVHVNGSVTRPRASLSSSVPNGRFRRTRRVRRIRVVRVCPTYPTLRFEFC